MAAWWSGWSLGGAVEHLERMVDWWSGCPLGGAAIHSQSPEHCGG